jgi:hypothetical protein
MDNAVLHVSDNAENGLDVIQRSNIMDNLDTNQAGADALYLDAFYLGKENG